MARRVAEWTDSSDDDTDDDSEEDPHEVDMPGQILESKTEAKKKNVVKVNSKVSMTYDTEAASRLAHDKIKAEQLKDPKCIKIAKLLEKGDSIESKRARLYFFWHEELLMRRFVPLKSDAEKAADEKSKVREKEESMKAPKIGCEVPPVERYHRSLGASLTMVCNTVSVTNGSVSKPSISSRPIFWTWTAFINGWRAQIQSRSGAEHRRTMSASRTETAAA